MTPKQKLEFIRQKVIAANPEIQVEDEVLYRRMKKSHWVPTRISLADVLLAMQKTHEWGVAVNMDGTFRVNSAYDENTTKKKIAWNLRQDDLNLNSQTWDFLYEILKAETNSKEQ